MKKAIPFLMLAILVSACNNPKETNENEEKMNETDNPLFVESSLPYYAPDFNKIKNEHFEPAILEGIAQQKKNIEEIANDPEAPTFENTVVALEKSGELLTRSLRAFRALSSAHTNETLQAVDEKIAPKLAAQQDAIYLNDALFQRFKTLHNDRQSLNLDPESLKLLENYYENFEIRSEEHTSELQ